MTYYKAIRPNGTDFYTGTVQWAPESGDIPAEGFIVNHPTSTVWEDDHSTHLCASTSPTECIGFEWPCRLLEVEPASQVHEHTGTKVSALAWRVVRELPATEALGPQGEAVVALIDGLRRLDTESLTRLADAAWDATRTVDQIDAVDAAVDCSWTTARDAVRNAAWIAAGEAAGDAAVDASGDTAQDTAWDTAWGVAVTLVVWDLIDPAYRDTITAPIRTVLPDLWADVSGHLPLTN